MSDIKQLVNKEQLGLLTETMNIGAGNAAAALGQILHRPVLPVMPRVHIKPLAKVSSILGDPASPVVCIRTRMVGDLTGGMFFIMSPEDKLALVNLAEQVTPGLSQLTGRESEEVKFSALYEVGNILAGVYLTAVHDFCGLNIYHTLPVLAVDMVQALLDEALVGFSLQAQTVLLVENEFSVEEHHIRTMLLIIPSADSVNSLVNALGKMSEVYDSA